MFDESKWVRKCPRCGNADRNKQVPHGITGRYDEAGNDLLLYYKCFQCGQRYLIPKIEDYEFFGSHLP